VSDPAACRLSLSDRPQPRDRYGPPPQVVEHHDIAALEGGAKDLPDVDAEGIAIHCAIEHPRRRHAAQPQSGDEGHGFPVPERHAVVTPLADRRPAIQPRHLRVDARLIEEDEALRVDEGLRRLP